MSNVLPQEEIDKINGMSRYDMCHMWRFHQSGDKYFDTTLPYWEHFEKRFHKLGGFCPEISKKLGWRM